MSTTVVTHGNRTFLRPRAHDWAGDRPDLKVASFPKALRFIAMQLNKKGCWLAFPIEILAQCWDDNPGDNLARLNDIMAHASLLTEAQVSYLRAAVTVLQERSQQ